MAPLGSPEFTIGFHAKFNELLGCGIPANEAAAESIAYASALETLPPPVLRLRSLEERADTSSSPEFALVRAGEEGRAAHFVPRTQETATVRHGSSLDLIRRGHMLINAEFNETDPEKDFKKWLSKGASPYFFAVVEPNGIMSCCLRCLLDGDWESYWPPRGKSIAATPATSPSPSPSSSSSSSSSASSSSVSCLSSFPVFIVLPTAAALPPSPPPALPLFFFLDRFGMLVGSSGLLAGRRRRWVSGKTFRWRLMGPDSRTNPFAIQYTQESSRAST
mmetsp:Transcript_6307/g.11821  ORF Transcript_6307/g.11821 Transcript_6307/m.11821 type:complete len:277 (+) Transcript_6307:142-972(+)